MTQRSVQNLHLFIGSNRWEKEQALRILQDKEGAVETRRFDLADKSLSWNELLQSLRTFPLHSKPQIFVLKQVEKCPARYQPMLTEALQQLPRQHVVVLETDQASPEDTFLGSLKGRATVRLFQPVKREQLPAWMAARTQARGKRIVREACLELLERGGEDLFFLDRAIEQLALYTGKRELVVLDDVRRLIGPLLFRTGFELARAVGRGQVLEALSLLSQLSPHEKLQAVIGSMGWHLRQMRQAQADQILERLLKLDVESKSGFSGETESLEAFLLSLAQKGGEFSGEA